jgi:hypothetical protein
MTVAAAAAGAFGMAKRSQMAVDNTAAAGFLATVPPAFLRLTNEMRILPRQSASTTSLDSEIRWPSCATQYATPTIHSWPIPVQPVFISRSSRLYEARLLKVFSSRGTFDPLSVLIDDERSAGSFDGCPKRGVNH